MTVHKYGLWCQRLEFKSQLCYLQQGDSGKSVTCCGPRFLNNKLEMIYLNHRAPRKPLEQAWQLASIQCQIWSYTRELQPPAKCSQLTFHTTHLSVTPRAALTHSAAASALISPGPTGLQASKSHEGGFFLFFFPLNFLFCIGVSDKHSVLSDSATSWTIAPLYMECSRQEYWNGLSFPSPGDLSDPGIKPRCPALQADSLPSEPPGKPYWRIAL